MSRKEDIVTYVLYQLGGGKEAIHIEEIAYRCHKLAQPQFSWQIEKYKEYPDLRAVYYALDAVSRGRQNELVEKVSDRSKGGQRYKLTQFGAQWIKENESRLAKEFGVPSQKRREPQHDVQQYLRELKKHDRAFKRYKNSGEKSDLSVYEFIDFLGCSLETSPTAVRKKFADMKTKAELANDIEVKNFLALAETKFPNLLSVQ